MSNLIKAYKNGVRGKFRRVDGGKLKFIRSEDGKIEKDAISTAGMNADLGSPSAEVLATGGMSPGKKNKYCTCVEGKKCTCKLQKQAPSVVATYTPEGVRSCGEHGVELTKCGCEAPVEKGAQCDCNHPGTCESSSDCPCNCEDCSTCTHRLADDLDSVIKKLQEKVDPRYTIPKLCPTCGK